MTHFKTILGTLAACSAISISAFGGGNTTDSSLPKEVAQIHCMVGEWRGTATMQMGKDKAKLQVSLSCEATSGGWGVACKSRFVGLPSGPYEETDLFGFDPHTRKYHWFSVTNAGETHDHVAAVPTGDTLKWVYRGKLDGKAFTETIDFKFNKDSTRILVANKGVAGGATLFSMKGQIRKQ
jgi:hypothetical protein